jgi:hypothetical protein
MKFIKLSRFIINTSKISTVQVFDNRYIINISSSNTSGFMLAGSGMFNSNETIIHVCQEKDPDDYHIVTKWVMDLKN